MNLTSRFAFALAGMAGLVTLGSAQVPDLLNALDAGGKAMGMGGANNVTNVDTLSTYYNPAGLAYLSQREIGLTYRNLPKSRTRLSGDFEDPHFDTDPQSGSRTIGHLGFAAPVKSIFGRGSGGLGLSYTVGGYMDDTATATTLDNGQITLHNYRLDREAKSEFFTLAYGNTLGSGAFSYGLGIVMARQKVDYSETATAVDSSNNQVPFGGASGSSNGTGVGVLVGALYTPTSMPDLTVGVSYRSEMNLSGNSETESQFDKIPARLMIGGTLRRDGFRQGKDYLLLGAQASHYFPATDSSFFVGNSQTNFGFGAEYNVGFDSFRLPLRVGFMIVDHAQDGFASRNAFTFGLGYRPIRSSYGLDLNWAVPEGGGWDFSIAASYRF